MKYVVGVQGCAWTEFMNDEKQLEYMIFPRLLAVAEMAWTQEKKQGLAGFQTTYECAYSTIASTRNQYFYVD